MRRISLTDVELSKMLNDAYNAGVQDAKDSLAEAITLGKIQVVDVVEGQP